MWALRWRGRHGQIDRFLAGRVLLVRESGAVLAVAGLPGCKTCADRIGLGTLGPWWMEPLLQVLDLFPELGLVLLISFPRRVVSRRLVRHVQGLCRLGLPRRPSFEIGPTVGVVRYGHREDAVLRCLGILESELLLQVLVVVLRRALELVCPFPVVSSQSFQVHGVHFDSIQRILRSLLALEAWL